MTPSSCPLAPPIASAVDLLRGSKLNSVRMLAPQVALIAGSRKSDLSVMGEARDQLADLGIAHEVLIVSAHRTPEWMVEEFAKGAEGRGLRVIIAAAGGAAHLPGMVAALTLIPVFGVPIPATELNGIDALLSMVQMPAGVPVGTLAIGKAGAVNAALLAAEVLALHDPRCCAGACRRCATRGATRCWPRSRRPTRRHEDTLAVPILPGAAIGILGGGQLARMTAMAARSLGYGVRVLDPDPRCAAGAVADEVIAGAFDDPACAAALARGSAVVTYEIETIGPAALAAAAQFAPVHPSPAILGMVQDRLVQKEWLAGHGFPVGPYRAASTAAEIAAAAQALGPVRLKARRGATTAAAQGALPSGSGAPEAAAAQAALGSGPVVCEQELALRRELSVLVARRADGTSAEVKVFPPAQNWHEDGILALSVLPGALAPALVAKAEALGRALAEALSLVGLLAIEFFETDAHGLLVNELSPRPHNTFHATETACLTSQFEQLVRAVCGLPLGSTDVLRPTALANLLGDLWLGPTPPHLDRALALPGVYLTLYGKEPRRGRKIGHLLAVGHTPEEALKLVREARARL